jgi:hypothetical protein
MINHFVQLWVEVEEEEEGKVGVGKGKVGVGKVGVGEDKKIIYFY